MQTRKRCFRLPLRSPFTIFVPKHFQCNMNLSIQTKQLGKRRCCIEPMQIELPDETLTDVRSLITAIVRRQVEGHNQRPGENDLLKYLTQEEIDDRAESGKVGFGVNYNGEKASAEVAVKNALQAYENGIFRLFVNDEEAGTADTPLVLREGDRLTFVRLTLLSGRLW